MSVPLSADPQHHRLVITATEQPGNYRVQSGGREAGFDRPLSVNLAPEQTQLERLDKKSLPKFSPPIKSASHKPNSKSTATSAWAA